MTDRKGSDGELSIHLDLAGLAALLKAVEAAMVDGRGHLTLGEGCGIAVTSSRSPEPFGEVIVKFHHHVGPSGEDEQPYPELHPHEPVLELQG